MFSVHLASCVSDQASVPLRSGPCTISRTRAIRILLLPIPHSQLPSHFAPPYSRHPGDCAFEAWRRVWRFSPLLKKELCASTPRFACGWAWCWPCCGWALARDPAAEEPAADRRDHPLGRGIRGSAPTAVSGREEPGRRGNCRSGAFFLLKILVRPRRPRTVERTSRKAPPIARPRGIDDGGIPTCTTSSTLRDMKRIGRCADLAVLNGTISVPRREGPGPWPGRRSASRAAGQRKHP